MDDMQKWSRMAEASDKKDASDPEILSKLLEYVRSRKAWKATPQDLMNAKDVPAYSVPQFPDSIENLPVDENIKNLFRSLRSIDQQERRMYLKSGKWMDA